MIDDLNDFIMRYLRGILELYLAPQSGVWQVINAISISDLSVGMYMDSLATEHASYDVQCICVNECVWVSVCSVHVRVSRLPLVPSVWDGVANSHYIHPTAIVNKLRRWMMSLERTRQGSPIVLLAAESRENDECLMQGALVWTVPIFELPPSMPLALYQINIHDFLHILVQLYVTEEIP